MAHLRKTDVAVADAEPVSRCGLVHLIESHPRLRICGEAQTLASARDLCVRAKPAVLLLDVAMADGLAFIKDLPRWSRATRVVVFTRYAAAVDVQRALQAGAAGYVTRTDPVTSLIAAVLAAAEGRRQVSPSVEDVLLERLAHGIMDFHDDEAAALSNREREVFRLIGSGLGTRAVASELSVSVKTIETHRQRIKEKLHVRDGVELQRRAVLFHGRR